MNWPYSFPFTRKDLYGDVPQSSDSTCNALVKALLRLPLLLFQNLRQIFDENGNLTATFLSMIYTPGDMKMSFLAPNPNSQKGVWLKCDGTVYLQSQYPDLFAAIGTLFNNQTNPNVFTYDSNGNMIITAVPAVPAGSFRVPDMRALTPMATGSLGSGALVSNGVAFGEENHQLVPGEDVPHQHFLFSSTEKADAWNYITDNAFATWHGGDGSANENYTINGVAQPPTLGMSEIVGGTDAAVNSPGAVAFNVATADGSASTSQTYKSAQAHNNMQPSIGCYFYVFAGVPVTANSTSTDQTLVPI